jgi:hypothetical protein
MSRTPYRLLTIEQKETRQRSIKKWHKTKKGFLSRLYKNMRSRVEGIQTKKIHLYLGLYLLPRMEFYSWALNTEEFNDLFDAWGSSGRQRKLTPSIDRIDASKGYEISNMRWLTHSQNSKLGAHSRWSSL